MSNRQTLFVAVYLVVVLALGRFIAGLLVREEPPEPRPEVVKKPIDALQHDGREIIGTLPNRISYP